MPPSNETRKPVERVEQIRSWAQYESRIAAMVETCSELLNQGPEYHTDVVFFYHLFSGIKERFTAAEKETPAQESYRRREGQIATRNMQHFKNALGSSPTRRPDFSAAHFSSVHSTDALLLGNIVDQVYGQGQQYGENHQVAFKSSYATISEISLIDRLLDEKDEEKTSKIRGYIYAMLNAIHERWAGQLGDLTRPQGLYADTLRVIDHDEGRSITQVAGNRIVVNSEIFEARGGVMEANIPRGADLSNLQGCTKLNLRVQNDRFEALRLPHDLRDLTISSDDPNCVMELVELPVNVLTTDFGGRIKIKNAPQLRSILSTNARTLDLVESGSPQLQDVQALQLDQLIVPKNIQYQRWQVPKFSSVDRQVVASHGVEYLALTGAQKEEKKQETINENEPNYEAFSTYIFGKVKERDQNLLARLPSYAIDLLQNMAQTGGLMPICFHEDMNLEPFWRTVFQVVHEDPKKLPILEKMIRNTFQKMIEMGLNYQPELERIFPKNIVRKAINGIAVPDRLQNLSESKSALSSEVATGDRLVFMGAFRKDPLEFVRILTFYPLDTVDKILSDPYVRQEIEKMLDVELYLSESLVANRNGYQDNVDSIAIYKFLLRANDKRTKAEQWHDVLSQGVTKQSIIKPDQVFISWPYLTEQTWPEYVRKHTMLRFSEAASERTLYDQSWKAEIDELVKPKGLLFKTVDPWKRNYQKQTDMLFALFSHLEKSSLTQQTATQNSVF